MQPLTYSRGMRKAIGLGMLGMLCSVASTGQAHAAITISDVNTTDGFVIDQNPVTSNNNKKIKVKETISENNLIPYTSHDGYGIVTDAGGYFDSVVNFDNAVAGQETAMIFKVKNKSGLDWSDYHVEFWDPTFTTRYNPLGLSGSDNDQFESWSNSDGVVSFYAPGSHENGEKGKYVLYGDLTQLGQGDSGSFGIRQVATAVPEPGSIALIGVGLAGLLGYRKVKEA